MNKDQLQALNAQFALADQLRFTAGPGGLLIAEIRNQYASATVALNGGHVLAYQPHDSVAVLWVSQHSLYVPGKAIRGGIPICWPWFGPHPSDPTLPAHGFARTTLWQVVGSATVAGGATQLRLELTDSERTRAMWPHAFQLTAVVTVGSELQVDLVVHNRGAQPFTYSGALHSYFNVSEIGNISIRGLEDVAYIDQLNPGQRQVQRGPITIDREVDRIYLDTEDTCIIDDAASQRQIRIAKAGSRSTVVWNPWIAKAQRMADFGDEEYRTMVCIETANAADDHMTVAPGKSHHLQATISVVRPADE